MSAPAITVAEHDERSSAMALMRRGRFRHLPVVRDGQLVGVLARSDLEAAEGLSPDEAWALAERAVGEAMTPGPLTVSPTEPVEVAARLLAEHRVGCLPVVSGDALVGILTESDLFRVLVEMLGLDEASTRISVTLPDVPGALGRAMTIVGDLGVNVVSVITEPGPSPGTRVVVLRAATINAVPVVSALAAAGFPAEGPGRPGKAGR